MFSMSETHNDHDTLAMPTDTVPVEQRSAHDVPAGLYALDPTHARVLFAVSHMGLTTFYGEFPGAEGELHLDPARPDATRLQVTLKTASITTTNAVLDQELRSATWLDADRFPTITFTSSQVRPTGAETADVVGELTLHGVTKEVTLTAKFVAAGRNWLDKKFTIGFEVAGTIKRSEFGVREDIPMIGDTLKLMISAPFV
jgi:polyisoprenoid-binding protein YceI